MNGTGAITVLIPAYKAEATMSRALASVRAQTHAPDRIVIVDDGSPEPLRIAPEMHGGIPCTVIRLDRNMGSSHALNQGLSVIDTPWTAFLDADDEWHGEKLAQQLAYAARRPGVALVATGLRFLDFSGHTLLDVATAALPESPLAQFASLMEDCVIGKPSVLARTEVLRALGGFNTDLKVGEDQDMWLRIAAGHPVEIVPSILTFAHDTAGSLSKRTDIAPDYLWKNVILPLLNQHRGRLTAAQIHCITGSRTQQAAIAHLARGSYFTALAYLIRASLHGYQPAQNLRYALTGFPPLAPFKRALRRP